MKDLKHIVVLAPGGLDPSGAIARGAGLLGDGGTMTVLDVLQELPLLARAVLPDDVDTMHLRERERERELTSSIDGLMNPLRSAIKVRVLAGSPAVTTSTIAAEENAQLLLKVSIGATPQAELDAVDRKLLRKCPCAVWMVAPGPARPIRNVLAGIEVYSDDADHALARRIVAHAQAVAKPDAAKVYAIHAWNVVGEGVLRRHLSPSDVEAHIRHMHLDADAAFRRVLDGLDEVLPGPNRCLVRGEPASAIAGMAGKIGADLIVIGTVARAGLPGLVIGNTAESLLSRINGELLVVKPQGFVSPLLAGHAAAVMLPPIYA